MSKHPDRYVLKAIALAVVFSIDLAQGQAQQQAKIDIVADLIDLLPQGKTEHALSLAIRSPGVAGGMEKRAIFHHPASNPKITTIKHQLHFPRFVGGETLFLSFGIGIADGARFDRGEDGVTFFVEVNGNRLFERHWRKCEWGFHALDLARFRGGPVTLTLGVDSGSNNAHDWAMWAEPKVMMFSHASQAPPSRVPVTGIVLVKRVPGQAAKLRLGDRNNSNLIETVILPVNTSDLIWTPIAFRMASAPVLVWEKGAGPEPSEVIVGLHSPKAVLKQVAVEQAVPIAGETIPLVVKVVNQGFGYLTGSELPITLSIDNKPLKTQTIPPLAPGGQTVVRWNWQAPEVPATFEIRATIPKRNSPESITYQFKTHPSFPAGNIVELENDYLRIEFIPSDKGYEYAKIYGRDCGRWYQLGAWKPLAAITGRSGVLEVVPTNITKATNVDGEVAKFTHHNEKNGIKWTTQVEVDLSKDGRAATIHHQFSASRKSILVKALGPNIYVGDRRTGHAKSWGLFPGLEYLNGPEPSSNRRDMAPPKNNRYSPHPNKITIPLMSVTLGPDSKLPPGKPGSFFAPDSIHSRDQVRHPDSNLLPKAPLTLSLIWNPLQKWDGIHPFPTAHFSSPNDTQMMVNHLMGLSLPSVPEFAPEFPGEIAASYVVKPARPLTIESRLAVTRGGPLSAVRNWLDANGGLPEPTPVPRSFTDELALCRRGFLETVRDRSNGKFRHCIGWSSSHSAGFAMLLWVDGLISGDKQARSCAVSAAEQMLREGGAGRLIDHNLTHLVRWEFPFHYGYLAEAMRKLDNRMHGLAKSQHPEGGWRQPAMSGKHAKLGKTGDAVSGTVAKQAMELMRHARVTGDTNSLQAGLKALSFLNEFKLPRGAQMWECPMYQPDILAAAYAVAANLDGWRCSGDEYYLRESIRWAETGVPFVYLWSLPDKSQMLGATIPVFGSTFFSHSWLGIPVQWCGLVYSYHVWHLQEALSKHPALANRLISKSELRFTPTDWERITWLITSSAMHQQIAKGEKVGTYPDSIVNFEKPMPAFINPEDILANVLALNGHDPDIKTVRFSRGSQVIVSSAARLEKIQNIGENSNILRVAFEYYPGQPVHFLVSGYSPKEVRLDGALIQRAAKPPNREAGWWENPATQRVYVTTPRTTHAGVIELRR